MTLTAVSGEQNPLKIGTPIIHWESFVYQALHGAFGLTAIYALGGGGEHPSSPGAPGPPDPRVNPSWKHATLASVSENVKVD